MQVERQQERSFGRHSPEMINKVAINQSRQNESSKRSQEQTDEEPQEQMGLLQQFKQQMMKAWQPVPTLTKTIIMFFILSAIFLSIGVVMIILSKNLNESTIRYDIECATSASCTLKLEVTDLLQAPVFVYYEIHNFYQNHRLYAASFSYDQLTGNTISQSAVSFFFMVQAESACSPIVFNRDLYKNVSAFNPAIPLIPDQIANPCGLIAYTVFNDSFILKTQNGAFIPISNKGIAWPTDIEKYKVTDPNNSWIDITDERFMNWMRIAAMSDFRKLWGRIEQDVVPGNYTILITNNYNLSKINGEKYFVLSTSNFFGSKSNFLSISYISVGSVCCLMGFLFLMRKLSKKNKLL